jgi:glutamate/aspartate transport system substrate-binding protein
VQSSLAKIRDTGVVAIAFRPDAVPFAYLDENKQPIGYGIDICREIVRLMERELKKSLRVVFVEVNAKTRFEIVNTGKADMECGTTINDAQRRKIADYSMPYQFSGPRFLVRTESKVRGIEDWEAAGSRSCRAPTRFRFAAAEDRRRCAARCDDGRVQDVRRGTRSGGARRSRSVCHRRGAAAAQRAKSKDPSKLAIVGAYLVLEPIAILLRKGDVEFKKVIDRHLAALMLDGVVGRFYTSGSSSRSRPTTCAGSADDFLAARSAGVAD